MAKVEVKGLVSRVFYGGKGVVILEAFTTQTGETKSRRYTAWFRDPVHFAEGSAGTISGSLSAKIEKWTDAEGNPKLDQTGVQGQSVTLSINDAVWEADSEIVTPPKMPANVASAVEAFGWTPIPTHLDDAPF